MANQPKTPISSFRLPTEVKAKAQAKAKAEGRTLTDVIVTLLTEYIAED